jgi:hypothetical protein
MASGYGRSKNDMQALRAGAREWTSSQSENDLFANGAAPRGMTSRRSENDLQAHAAASRGMTRRRSESNVQGHAAASRGMTSRRSESDVQGHGAASRGMTSRRSENDLQAHVAGVRERRHEMELPRPRSTECFNTDGRLLQDRFLRRWERVNPDVAPSLPLSAPAPGPPVKRLHPDAEGPMRTPVQGPMRTPVRTPCVQGPLRTPVHKGPPVTGTPVSVQEKARKTRTPKGQPSQTRQYAMNRDLAAWCAQERERALQPRRQGAEVSKAAKAAKAAKAESSASTPVALGATVTKPHLALLVMPLYVLTSLAFWAHELLRTLSVDLLRHVARLVPGVRAAQSPQAELERCKEELKIAEAALARAQMAVLEVETRMADTCSSSAVEAARMRKSVSVPCMQALGKTS